MELDLEKAEKKLREEEKKLREKNKALEANNKALEAKKKELAEEVTDVEHQLRNAQVEYQERMRKRDSRSSDMDMDAAGPATTNKRQSVETPFNSMDPMQLSMQQMQ